MATRRMAPVVLRPATTPIKPLSKTRKLQIANQVVVSKDLLKKFKTLGASMSFGFNASNSATHGTLKLGPGVSVVDFAALRVSIVEGAGPPPNWPVSLHLDVETGHFYVIDVFALPTSTAIFTAVSHRTTSGANFTTSYSISVDSQSPHALFVLHAHGTADGTKNSYRVDLGADKPWTFEKIEVTRLD